MASHSKTAEPHHARLASLVYMPPELWWLILDNLTEEEVFGFGYVLRRTAKNLHWIPRDYAQKNRLFTYKKNKLLTPNLWDYYAKIGSVECLKWLIQTSYPSPRTAKACALAASQGHLSTLLFLREKDFPWDKEVCIEAAESGHLDCLRFAHENGCTWNEETCSSAALNGHLLCLQYAHENGCKWDKYTCACAAYGGHIDCLMYAHENGCNWDEVTCSEAAQNGHIECLRYAHENGCLWDENTSAWAVSGESLPCFEYLQQNSCPCDHETLEKAKIVFDSMDCSNC